ncbi:type 1 glycerol-3-phosphate oxidase [Enterococcus olivae]
MTFSFETRKQNIEQAKEKKLDLLIIGGGITGAGVAVQAAAAGMKTALVEMQDFAEGTSSRSTKLVHGGLRYLKTFDVEVVADTVKERAIVQRISPHIPKADPMLLPIYGEAGATFTLFSLQLAMDLYDQLAEITETASANVLLTKAEILEREPDLCPENLEGGGVYLDFNNNDARLVIENIKQAQVDGGLMISRAKVIELLHDVSGKAIGAVVEDQLSGETFMIQARVIINATGAWSDELRRLDHTNDLPPQMRPTKGVHLVVDRSKLSVSQPIYFDTGKNDGRMIFVVPRGEKTYFGTTDTDYQGELEQPRVEPSDVDYLLAVVNHRFPKAQLTVQDIEASWAGLRPLIASNGGSDYNGGSQKTITEESFQKVVAAVKEYVAHPETREKVEKTILEAKASSGGTNPSQVSRGSSLTISPNGLLTLAGGKLTDYRLMAEGAIQKIQEILANDFQRNYSLIDSTEYPVSGGHIDHQKVEEELARLAKLAKEKGLSEDDARYLAHLYGSNLPTVLTYEEPVTGLSVRDSYSLNYALYEEAVLTPTDFLMRRTNFLLFMRGELDQIKEPVIAKMKNFFQWTETETEGYTADLETIITASDLREIKEQIHEKH